MCSYLWKNFIGTDLLTNDKLLREQYLRHSEAYGVLTWWPTLRHKTRSDDRSSAPARPGLKAYLIAPVILTNNPKSDLSSRSTRCTSAEPMYPEGPSSLRITIEPRNLRVPPFVHILRPITSMSVHRSPRRSHISGYITWEAVWKFHRVSLTM